MKRKSPSVIPRYYNIMLSDEDVSKKTKKEVHVEVDPEVKRRKIEDDILNRIEILKKISNAPISKRVDIQ